MEIKLPRFRPKFRKDGRRGFRACLSLKTAMSLVLVAALWGITSSATIQAQEFAPDPKNAPPAGPPQGDVPSPVNTMPQGKAPPPHPGQGAGPLQRLINALSLTPEQVDKVKSIQQEGRTKAHALQQQLKEKRKAMFDYVASPEAKEEKAVTMQQELMQLQGQVNLLRLSTWFKIRGILTPDQLNQISQVRATLLKQMAGDGHHPGAPIHHPGGPPGFGPSGCGPEGLHGPEGPPPPEAGQGLRELPPKYGPQSLNPDSPSEPR